MKLGFISPNLPGHLNPMTALARHLQARNHEVVFLYSTGANGLPFVPGPGKDHINENRTEQSKRDGEDALRSGLRHDQASISFREVLHSLTTACRLCRERYRQRRQLLEMDDRELKDIGITREQAEQEGRKPLWNG